MKNKPVILAIILLSLSCIIPVHSALVQKLDTESGLSNNCIRTIYKDNKGLIWIGTDNGLDSYDGLQIVSYGKRIRIPVKGTVDAIMELEDHSYIIGTSWGAYVYSPVGNRISTIDFGILALDVRQIMKTKNGQTLLGTDKGLFILSPDKKKALPYIPELKNVLVSGIVQDDAHNLWITTDNTIFRLNRQKQLLSFPVFHKPADNRIKAISLMGNSLFLGTSGGLYSFNIQSRNLSINNEFGDIQVNSLANNGKGDLYLGTETEGIIIYNTLTRQTEYIKGDGIPAESISYNTVISLLYDKTGILWAGTSISGLNKIIFRHNSRFRNTRLPGIRHPNIRSFYITPQDEFFIGSRNGLIHLDAQSRLVNTYRIDQSEILTSKILTTIYPCPWNQDLLLIGFYGGGVRLFNRKTGVFTYFSSLPALRTGSVYKFRTDTHNNLWIATLDGLFRYNMDDRMIVRYDLTSLMSSNENYTLDIDSKGRIWVGTRTGVCYYSPASRKFHLPGSLRNYRYQCTAIHCDKQGDTWLCFNKGGVLQIDKDQKTGMWLTTEIGLPQNSPVSVIRDKASNLWIGTHKGLYKVTSKDKIKMYGVEDGISGEGFCPEAVSMDSKNNLWWSNERGMVSYIPQKSKIERYPYNIIFTNLLINGNLYSTDTLTTVKMTSANKYDIVIRGSHNNNLEFKFSALNYEIPHKNNYDYRLTGNGYHLSNATPDNSISYNDLKPGNYTLTVNASDNDGLFAQHPLEIRFSIAPYFYETTWFILTIIIIMGGCIIYYTRTYIISMKDKIMSQLEESKKRQSPGSGIQRVSDEKGELIKEKLLQYMQEEKPFLNPGLRQSDVATAIGYSVHEISEVINNQLNLNFSDFINSFRIEEIKRRVAFGDDKTFTLSAIAKQCGFQASSSFLRAFKKATGVTPSQYFKSSKSNPD